MNPIYSQVAALLRAENISILDYHKASVSLKECASPKSCVTAYQEMYSLVFEAAKLIKETGGVCLLVNSDEGLKCWSVDGECILKAGDFIGMDDGSSLDVLAVIK